MYGNGGNDAISNDGDAARFTVANSIVAGTARADGTAAGDATGNYQSRGYNLVGATDHSNGFGALDRTGTAAAPLAAGLGSLADNGGPTLTLLPVGGSVALNGGSNALVPSGIATDQRGQARTADGTVDIGSVEVRRAVTVTAPAAQSATVAAAGAFALGTFAAAGTTGPYAVTVDWGDGSAAGTYAQAAAGTITAAAAHTYAAVGNRTVTVTVADSGGTYTGSAAFAVVVVAAAPSIRVTPPAGQAALIGTSQSIGLGSFARASTAGPYTVTVTWADGSAPTTFTVDAAGTIPAQPHAFAAAGTAEVGVTVTSPAGVTATAVFEVVVSAGPTPTAVALAASPSPATVGDAVTLTATVAPATATGTVVFMLGDGFLAQAQVADGTATYTTTALPGGADAVTAVYGGSPTDATGTSATVTVDVREPVVLSSTTTLLTLSTTHKTAAQPLTLAAHVDTAGGPATGTITFDADGTPFGTADLPPDGTVTLAVTSAVAAGVHAITAAYSGDAGYLPSTSAAVTLTVTDHALTPTVLRSTLPASVVGGAKVRGSVAARLTDQLTGDASGTATVTVYAARATALDPATDAVVGTAEKKVRLGRGRATTINVPVKSLPATLGDGTYHLLLASTDPLGDIEVADTGRTITVAAAHVALSATFAPLSRSALTAGTTVAIVNAGNVVDASALTVTVGLSSDAAGLVTATSGAGTVRPPRLTLRPGRAAKVRVGGWQSLVGSLPSGTYDLTVTLTDAAGNAASAVSTAVTV